MYAEAEACYQAAGKRIGWFDRDPGVGAMRDGRHLIGFGMATSIYPVAQMPALSKGTEPDLENRWQGTHLRMFRTTDALVPTGP